MRTTTLAIGHSVCLLRYSPSVGISTFQGPWERGEASMAVRCPLWPRRV